MITFIKTKFKISDYQTNIELILQSIIITFVVKFEVKYNIGFGIPIEFLSERKKNYSNHSRNNKIKEIGPLWS